MEAMEAAAKEAEVPDDAERRLPSPPSTPGSEASEETPMHAAWWAEERPDLFLPVPLLSRAITIPRSPCSLRGTVVAVDGKFSSTRQTWGVGVFDIKAGIGHVARGCYAGCSSASIGENGMEQSTVEAIAVHMGFDWVRKRQRLPLSLFRSNGFRRLEKDITLISDRTATMVTMMRFGRVAARQFDSQLPGFEVAIHNAAVSMVKMLLLFTKVVIIHKSVEPFQAAQDRHEWTPDLLALWGLDARGTNLRYERVRSCFHLIRWDDAVWRGPLLTRVELSLRDLGETLAFFNCPSYAPFVEQACT